MAMLIRGSRDAIVVPWLLPVCIALCAGCTTVSVQKIPPQEGVYPAQLMPDAPLVLAIPGLVVPGLDVTQQQHFGYLVQMLADEGIPCRELPYNTREDPLSTDAALFSSDLSIAWTRVGPAMIREIEIENERRAALGIPPVRKLVLFGYSQGGVIGAQIAGRIFYLFRKEYGEAARAFGDEWTALQKDPEFKYFINALDDYVVVRNIKVQNENFFARSPELRRFYDRARAKLEKQFDQFMQYLVDPSSRFPGVKQFEGLGTPYYPKRYGKIREYAAARGSRSTEEKERNKQFFIDYAQYRDLLNVEPYFITAAASLFGSPQANDTLNLVRWVPFVKYFIGREFYQIKQTELGTKQQIERIEKLVQCHKDDRYPVTPRRALFLVGANGDRGDGLVDQPAAHLSRHALTRMRVVGEAGKGARLEAVEHDRLPPLVVVPLEVMHFPEKVMWGLLGTRYGAAYMVKGNPGFPYLLDFLKGDWPSIEKRLSLSSATLSQFMVEVSFTDAGMSRFGVLRNWQSENVAVTGRYFNRDSGTTVWTGHFKKSGLTGEIGERARLLNLTEMIPGVRHLYGKAGDPERLDIMTDLRSRAHLFNPVPLIPGKDKVLGWTGYFEKGGTKEGGLRSEEAEGEVRFAVELPGGRKVPLACTVYPGCISFMRIETNPKMAAVSGVALRK